VISSARSLWRSGLLALALVGGSATAAQAQEATTTTLKDLTTCINSNPRPDCGVAPQASGDRGGSAQYMTFGAMCAGLAVIGTVIVRSTRRAARARDARPTESRPA
jgi:transcription elongation factor